MAILQDYNHRKIIHLLLRCTSQLSMPQIFQIQAQVIASPIPSIDPNLIANKFIAASSSHSNLLHSVLIFNHYLSSPNIYAYNVILKAFTQHNAWHSTIAYFNNQLLLPDAPYPDEYTFTSVLKACSGLSLLLEGQKIHCFVTKYGCESNLFVTNSLIDMYFKVGCSCVAQKLFDEITVRDVVSWNTLISGYCFSGMVDKARIVFDGMMDKNLVSCTTMITGYAKVGNLEEARHLFENMPMKNVVSWNAMIAGYAQNEKYADAIELFRQMQREVGGLAPNSVTLVSVLSACAHLGALDLGKWIHKFVRQRKMEMDLFLGNALADMYAKCGCMLEAKGVFHQMKERDVISWTVIIMGLAKYGYAEEAFKFFAEMIEDDLKPNDISFMGVLTACTHAGLVDKGMEYFDTMARVYGITATVEHYGCVVDLLSRAGRLDQAEAMINSMPMQPNVIVWGALLGGCSMYKEAERGERIARYILELDPNHSGSHVYLANAYASVGRLDDAVNSRLRMRENKLMKTPACSWI